MDTIVSIFMLAGLALSAGAIALWRKGRGKQAGLMLLAAMLMFGNVVIWLAPTDDGRSLVDPHGSADR